MTLQRHSWRIVAAGLMLVALFVFLCGLVFILYPATPTGTDPDPVASGWQVGRGCFFGPAFVLLFFAYIAFAASRRRDSRLRAYEVITALIVGVGMTMALFALAVIVTPESTDSESTMYAMMALCLLPGLFLTACAGIYWYWARWRGMP